MGKGESQTLQCGVQVGSMESLGMRLEFRLKQWVWVKRYSSFFIPKGLLEDLHVVTSFASSSSYGSLGFKHK